RLEPRARTTLPSGTAKASEGQRSVNAVGATRATRTPASRSVLAWLSPSAVFATTTARAPGSTPWTPASRAAPEPDPWEVVPLEDGMLLHGAGRDHDTFRTDAEQLVLARDRDERPVVD